MTRTILTGLALVAACAALYTGGASAQTSPAPVAFTIDIGTAEVFGLLPYLEQDAFTAAEGRSMSFELMFDTAYSDVVRAWRAAGPRSATITLLGADGAAVATYRLEHAWLGLLSEGELTNASIVARRVSRVS